MEVYHFKQTSCNFNEVPEYSLSLKDACVPLVIDNGSYNCRAGWANSCKPSLDFKNVIAKNRGNRKEKDWDLQIANDIPDIEAVRWLLRTPHDFNVVVNYSIQEILFDYAFKRLGINSDGCISHPLLITEPIANPAYSRKNMSELLFEAYNVSKLAYGIDCLFSKYYNIDQIMSDTFLIISSGFQSTHILPVVLGQPDIKNALRINLGGYNCTAFMQRLLQLKYPHYASKLNLTRMEQIVHELCYVPIDYNKALKTWQGCNASKSHSTVLSFNEKESLNAKSKNFNIVVSLEKQLKRKEHKLNEIECIVDLENDNPEAALKLCKDCGFSSIDEAKQNIESINLNIQKIHSELNELHSIVSSVKCGIEKIQAPEIFFQPSLVGFDQCGLKECIDLVLNCFSPDIQCTMAQNVFLTGGTTKISGFKSRVVADLQEIRPYKSNINVVQAENPILDAWKGAARWAMSDHMSWITKQDFDEHGWNHLKQHSFSN